MTCGFVIVTADERDRYQALLTHPELGIVRCRGVALFTPDEARVASQGLV